MNCHVSVPSLTLLFQGFHSFVRTMLSHWVLMISDFPKPDLKKRSMIPRGERGIWEVKFHHLWPCIAFKCACAVAHRKPGISEAQTEALSGFECVRFRASRAVRLGIGKFLRVQARQGQGGSVHTAISSAPACAHIL